MKKRPNDPNRLTNRQLQVMYLAAEGNQTKEIGRTLGISKRTVDFHLFGAYKKLGAHNRIEAIRQAARLQIIPRIG